MCFIASQLPQIEIMKINNPGARLLVCISRLYWEREHYLLTRNRWWLLHSVHVGVFILAPVIGKQYPPKVKRAVIHVSHLNRQVGQGCNAVGSPKGPLVIHLRASNSLSILGVEHAITIILINSRVCAPMPIKVEAARNRMCQMLPALGEACSCPLRLPERLF